MASAPPRGAGPLRGHVRLGRVPLRFQAPHRHLRSRARRRTNRPPPSRSVSPVLLVCAAHRLVTELTANFGVCHPTSPVIISKAFPVHRTTRQRPSLRSPGLAAGGPLSGPLARPGRQPLRLGPQRGAPPHPSADGTGPASTACPPAPRLLGFTSSSPSTPRGALQAEPRPGSAEPCGFSTHA